MPPNRLNDVAVTDFVVNQRNGVKGLVNVISPKTLPSRYIQLPENRVTTEKLIIETGKGKDGLLSPVIPVIDVSDWKNPNVAEEICEAAATLGFFQIVNHGVSVDELNELRAAGRGFFDLPAEEKKRYWKGSSVSETAWYMTSFNPYEEAKLEWRDFIKFEFRPHLVDFAATWPSVCRDEVVKHSHRMKPIGKNILEILMNNLNASIDHSKEQILMGTLRMNINFYPECPEPKLAVGTGRHSDINTLTLLLQDDIIGSLYARYGDKWLHVPPVRGAIVVNIGDILQILSNDRYKSVEHVVMANQFLSRISFAFYCGPNNDSAIEPLAEVLENGEKPLYKSTVYSDYMKHFFERPHTGKKTIEWIKLP
ncbi:hypothetical protein EUTSA_v10023159mg [Eutrema salsugineum]|uniref:Fe2OG dioxygenase domain-containing protein n=1 Tax=Eutrema salsugineum TaxID=72664 RepID=V4M6S0_EUTSA|nr:feruloyl CoA ortho-hydroxylase 1 [Eutrema salsugineum]ESQ50722.1 hypothetical protein EUTSA_v10023159mg [Eutrema salsugineum]